MPDEDKQNINLIQKALKQKWGIKSSTMQQVGNTLRAMLFNNKLNARNMCNVIKCIAMLERQEQEYANPHANTEHELKVTFGNFATNALEISSRDTGIEEEALPNHLREAGGQEPIISPLRSDQSPPT